MGFDTYFNGFSIDKWKKYTVLKQLSLRLMLQGNAKVTLVSRQKLHEHIIEKIWGEAIVCTKQAQECWFAYPLENARGMLAFQVTAMEGGCTVFLADGAYCSEIAQEDIRDVKLGIGICTFQREAYIKDNLYTLKEEILERKDSILHGRLEVFIADNGGTLDIQALERGCIHLFANRNLGGAGGFTRCMLEMKKRQPRSGITHVLLMDDDVVIEPESLARTYLLLALAKPEYQDLFIGGSMLRLDQQAVQAEAGAVWNAGRLDSLKRGLDLRSCEACLYNEVEEYAQFHAWWYCCFPLHIVTAQNLPLPLFIRGDDVEYGLRNMKRLVMLNGICVWHEPFENKYTSFLEYYIIRNQLIVNAFHCPRYGAWQLNRAMLAHCLREVTYYRYKNVDLYLQGIRDFLKGPGWLLGQDGQALHQKVSGAGYRLQDVDTLEMGFHYPTYETSRNDHGQHSNKSIRLLTLNGLLLPAKGDGIAPVSAAIGVHFFRKKRVMNYDAASNRGFVTERSFWKSIWYIGKLLGMVLVNHRCLKKAQMAYRVDGKRLCTWGYWKGALGMDDKK